MAQLSYSKGYSKGFIVNTSAIAAKSLDLGVVGASSSDALLAAAVSEACRKDAMAKAGKDAEAADKAFLQSLSDGSAFAPSYGGSYAGGYYSGGSYGQFVASPSGSTDPDTILADVIAQAGDGGAEQADVPTEEHERMLAAPATTGSESVEPTWKGIVRRYKWWIVGFAAAILYIIFRRKK